MNSNGEILAAKYADEIAALKIGYIVFTRGQPKRPTWEIIAFESHTYRRDGRSAIVRSTKTGRMERRDVVAITRYGDA